MESEREIIDLQPRNSNPRRNQPINLNHYATKKSVAESMLDVVIRILLVVIARLNLNEVENQWRLNQLNNAATTLVFITVVINVFITAFGAHKTGFLAARASRNPL
ncbi:Ninjurin-2 [Sciurus carolinensis]|uniref:Ninjurin-2 n=1 Tax=Sciurus carolinensis TaxID=30640 RepID=A0AA41MKR2_SCICA|nr:Ninjurin-2 [Sciurus carolinensis]MBZ3873587.1 Ninjurin-2 [Sciurus carolinensis]